MGATRPKAAEKCPDTGRVAPISGSVLCLRLVVASFCRLRQCVTQSNNVTH